MNEMENWYVRLHEINVEDPLIAIACDGKLFHSLEDCKYFMDRNFNAGYGLANGSERIDSISKNPTVHIKVYDC